MRKQIVSLMLVSALVAGAATGCGGGDDNNNATSGNSSSTTSDAGSSDAGSSDAGSSSSIDPAQAPSTDGWDDSKKIYAYSWDNDFGDKLGVVLDEHPEYKDYVEIVNLGVGGTTDEYKTGIDTAFSDTSKYPSLVAADNDVAKYWSEDDEKTMDLAELGFTDEVLSNSYDFAKQYGTFNGKLKALTWQATPGSVFYRRDIAKKVLGSDDPDTVQEALKDWDTFLDTAAKLKDAGYKIVSGPSDVKYAIWDTQSQPWVTTESDGTEVLTLDDAVTEYLETGKKIYDNEYSNNTKMWDSNWFADMQDSAKVFCFFGCPWFVNSMRENKAKDGNWGAVVGPTSYHWGGTYVTVGKDTPNPELCAYLLYELTCDPDIGVKITNKFGDCVNNKAANERLAGGELSDDNAAKTFLGGQDPISVWAEAATGINLSNVTYQDATIKGYIDKASEGYNAGTYKSVDDAIKYVKDQADTQLGISAQE